MEWLLKLKLGKFSGKKEAYLLSVTSFKEENHKKLTTRDATLSGLSVLFFPGLTSPTEHWCSLRNEPPNTQYWQALTLSLTSLCTCPSCWTSVQFKFHFAFYVCPHELVNSSLKFSLNFHFLTLVIIQNHYIYIPNNANPQMQSK